MDHHIISSGFLNIDTIQTILKEDKKLKLSEASIEKINACRLYLDQKIGAEKKPVYGVNTGFGSLCKIQISESDIETLQYHLIRSHACGIGPMLSDEITKILILLKIQSLSYGYSGVSIETVWRLIDFFNLGMFPVIYEQGSLGASGDLCPLAHLSLPLIGEGEFTFRNEIKSAQEILQLHRLNPIKLKSKEGLALLNGTQFMNAHAIYCIIKAKKMLHWAEVIASISLEAFDAKHDPFLPQIHQIRNQEGQIKTAENMLKILHGSSTFFTEKDQVQDPYSFRCIPQVLGASRDAIAYCEKIFTQELNGVTDNPNIFIDEDLIISGGNFHGQPLAIALDFLCIALSEIANISERRTYRLLSGARDLPEFLTPNPGLNSGLMIPQYVAASIVSQNKQLCTPASVDSISSCNEQEDHVSMGANAATKCVRIMDNIEKVLAIELLTATQAFECRKKILIQKKLPNTSSPIIEKIFSQYRNEIPFIDQDRYLHNDIEKSIAFIKNYDL